MSNADTDCEMIRRRGLLEFVKRAWHIVEPAGNLIVEPHIELVCAHYEALARGEIRDLVINVPPGTSKSMIGLVLFQAWAWIERPGLKFLCVCYDEDLSHGFARRSMDLINSEWFQARWPHIQISRGSRANTGDFWTLAGGRRVSTMMGGRATGTHADILIIDDPHKPKDLEVNAESAMAILNTAWQDFTNTFSTRRADADTFRRVVVMQRLHEEDLAGRFLRQSGTVGLILPTEFDPARAYRSPWGDDWRTEAGELLCPRRFPQRVIEVDRAEMTPRTFAAQHQQSPSPAQGALFQREWFNQLFLVPPPRLRYLISVDATFKKKADSDFCCIQVWGWEGANFYLCDQVCERMSFTDTIRAITAMKLKWPHARTVLVEDKANGSGIIDVLSGSIPGVQAVNPEGGKEARANAVEPYLRAGNCHFANRAWRLALVEQAATFPVGSNDDQVDCMTQALLWMSGKTQNTLLKRAMRNARAGHRFR